MTGTTKKNNVSFMNNVSDMFARFGLAARLGQSFGGKRDYYDVFGYNKKPKFEDYYLRYSRQDIAKRIVNAPASATWRNPPVLKTTAKYKDKWDELVLQHSLWSEIERVDRLAGLGQYAVLLLGFDDGKSLDQPIAKDEKNQLIYVQPYAQPSASITKLDDDIRSPRFGLPVMYELETNNPMNLDNGTNIATTTTKFESKKIKVHWSRLVHVAEDCLDSNYLGTPRLESVINLLDDLLKVAGGSAETFWLIANRGMQVDVAPDAQLTQQDAEDLADEVDEYQHQLRRVLRTRGVKVNTLGSDSPDPKNTFDMTISLLSGATGIPKRVLTGSEAGQLASDQDRANWADRIKERRTTFAEPNVLLPLLTQLMNAGILPETKLSKLDYIWPPNFQLTPLEEAQSMAQKARAAINLSKQYNKGNMPLMTREECRLLIDLPEKPDKGTIPEMMQDDKSKAAPSKDTSKPTNDPANDPNAPDNAGPTDGNA